MGYKYFINMNHYLPPSLVQGVGRRVVDRFYYTKHISSNLAPCRLVLEIYKLNTNVQGKEIEIQYWYNLFYID